MIIRTSLNQEVSQLDKRLMGYTASMSYTFAQLCVIADPSSVLPIEMQIGGEIKQIEDVADGIIHKKEEDGDNVTIDLYPKDISYITAIMDGVNEYHPEFKVTVEDMRQQPGNEEIKDYQPEDKDQELQFKFIRLVMPEVNKDRRDLLEKLVKSYRDALTVQMDAMKVKTQAKLVPLFLGVPKEEIDAVNEQVDAVYKNYVEMADQLTEDKLQQIEEAYQEYLKLHPEEAGVQVESSTPESAAPEEPKAPEKPSVMEDFSNTLTME